VTSLEQMHAVAARAIDAYGRIDTWINNAGVCLFGPLGDVPAPDARRLFEVNYFGVVHGTLAALPYLRETGGTLINVGGEVVRGDAPQGHYAASKAAVRTFSAAIRGELEAAGVSVVVIEPSSVDTPFRLHARSYLGFTPPSTEPVYVPEVAAEVILRCAVQPRHEVRIGSGGTAPGRTASHQALVANETAFASSVTASGRKPGNLIEWSVPAGKLRGGHSGHVRVNSALTSLSLGLSPSMASMAMTVVSVAVLLLLSY
jgi:NAD(P)-dependent dehydrogenase (short-subunit alcohol dehydrogenase family)